MKNLAKTLVTNPTELEDEKSNIKMQFIRTLCDSVNYSSAISGKSPLVKIPVNIRNFSLSRPTNAQHICCAFVALDNKLYKMHGTYVQITKETSKCYRRREFFCQKNNYHIFKNDGMSES